MSDTPEPNDAAHCSRMVLQRRYLSTDMPAPWREWHDHPEPHQLAWSKGQFETLEENMRNACENYYEMSPKVEFRMVRRTDETVWEYSANTKIEDA
jgi:hypothetical protein